MGQGLPESLVGIKEGKCACTFHSHIFANGGVRINEQNKSIATGLFYVYIAICVRYQRSLTVQRGPKGQKKKKKKKRAVEQCMMYC